MNSRIAKLRNAHGLSQLQLAKLLHISPSAEGMYEQGRRTPSLETLIAMALLFHVSLDYLITGAEFVDGGIPPEADVQSITYCCRCCCRKCSGIPIQFEGSTKKQLK